MFKLTARPTLPTEPQRFAWFALGQGALWFLLPTLLFTNLPPAAIEGLAWGHAWPLGTHKQPPLQAWLLESAAWLGGRTDAGLYALNAGCLMLAYWAVWRLGCRLLTPALACMGVVALAGCIAIPVAVLTFSPDSVSLPLYALCGLLFWRAFTHDMWRDWLLLGLLAGLGLWGQYRFLLLLLGFAAFLLWEPQARAILNRPKAWVALLVALLVFLPHLNWLLENHWLPFVYARAQTVPDGGWLMSLAGWLRFTGGQLLLVAPVALLCWLARERKAFVWPEMTPGIRYLTVLAWVPFGLLVLKFLLVGGKPADVWSAAHWPFLGLWCAARWGSAWHVNGMARRLAAAVVLVVPLAVLGVMQGFGARHAAFPGRELAQVAERLWTEQGWRSPLTIVLGDNWLGGNVGWYSSTRPQVMYYGTAFYSPGVTHAMVRKQGALVVWNPAQDGEDLPQWALRHGGVGGKTVIRLQHDGQDIPIAMGVLAPQE